MNVHCIILARGGSQGIPKKNIIDFCGKPLIAWTIEQCISSKHVSKVWVSSDSDEILDVAAQYGAENISRPNLISGNLATSESAWQHAIKKIEKDYKPDLILAPQVTSPLRETRDINNAIELFKKEKYDSMFSASMAEDLFFWQHFINKLNSVNYDYKNRKRRQDIKEQIIENGSFYLFKPEVLKIENNRFGGRIGYSKMDFWKMFEVDNLEDLRMCSALMKEFLL